jgi:hypothetical protein
MAINPNNKVFVVNEDVNTQYGGVDPTGEFVAVSELGGSSYKVLTAKITQNGSSDPVLDILENTTGIDITFARGATGYYKSNTFIGDYNKVTITCTPGISPPAGICIFAYSSEFTPNVCVLTLSTVANYAAAYISGPGGYDGLLLDSFLEIRIYN